jgi:hypothetical protein
MLRRSIEDNSGRPALPLPPSSLIKAVSAARTMPHTQASHMVGVMR